MRLCTFHIARSLKVMGDPPDGMERHFWVPE